MNTPENGIYPKTQYILYTYMYMFFGTLVTNLTVKMTANDGHKFVLLIMTFFDALITEFIIKINIRFPKV